MKASGHYAGSAGADYYAWQRTIGVPGGRIEARKFTALIDQTDVVLDFGCGSGAMLGALTCRERIGVEVNAAARDEAAQAGLLVYRSLDEVASSSVDVVVSNHALEHTLEPLTAIGALLRVLVPGGRLVLCTPVDDWHRQRRADLSDINHHLYTWTPLLLGNLLTEAGFARVSASMLHHAWPPGWAWLDAHLAPRDFDRLCTACAYLTRRHQVMALAVKPGSDHIAGGAS
jgi:SAM-dependent methyltransferase